MGKLLCQVKDQIEKEVIDRKTTQVEILKQNSELGAELEHERNIRDREDTSLKASIATLKSEVSTERKERAADLDVSKRSVQSLEARVTEQFRDLRQSLDSEIEERSLADVHIEEQCVDIKAASDADHATIETLTTTLESGLSIHRHTQESEKSDRIADAEEIRKAVAKKDEQLLQLYSDLNSERGDRTQDITAIRSMLQTFDRHVSMKFQEVEDCFNAEAAERKDRECKLEKRFAELRGAVLIAVRGSRPGEK